ncbi:Mov34/MPN/PAD-1 family protein [Candidatus Termititenax aidoneus]|uniref:Mov34/MPN/PAD-1 family protein n=1 Tax=Termititenax aidoneus TaxID=2218524 RepID=A0A388T9M2_TERA1|nr:Mov34/MPN/PAD-1 family protein [Candidatus Termititenax aidoneus]
MFIITQHQYDLIMRQAQENYPYETGGVLCGSSDGVIKGVLPLYNQAGGDQHKEFGMSADDILRGHEFAKKHGLIFFGVYHTHPNGIAYPSDQDISNNQRFLFIISLRDRYNPEFAAYSVLPGRAVIREDIQVVNDNGITVIDIHTGKPKLSESVSTLEMGKLHTLIDAIVDERAKYPRLSPKNKFEASRFSFNTEA